MAAFTPPITLLPIACEALTRPCDLIRARAKAAPATVRALLRFMGRGDPCFAAASMGLESRGLPRPAPTSSSVPLSDIQGSRIQGFFARQAKQTRENDNPRIQTDPVPEIEQSCISEIKQDHIGDDPADNRNQQRTVAQHQPRR